MGSMSYLPDRTHARVNIYIAYITTAEVPLHYTTRRKNEQECMNVCIGGQERTGQDRI